MKKMLLKGAAVLSALFLTGNNALSQTNGGDNTVTAEQPKILIAYYSYSGNTKEVAKAIHEEVGGDLFEIKAEGSYPEEYRR